MYRVFIVFLILVVPSAYADKVHAVFLIHEKEYETKRTVPEFAEEELVEKLGWKCTYLFGDGEHNIPGTKVLKKADVLFISLRRQALPAKQLNDIKAFVTAGKPVVGIRTASHAFTLRSKKQLNGFEWVEFDKDVLGGNYHDHYDNKAADTPRSYIWSTEKDGKHPIMEGVTLEKRVTTCWLYQVKPLAESATPFMWGEFEDNPPEPVAWTNTSIYGGPVFYTSLGHPDDFESPDFRRLLVNGFRWVLEEAKGK
jgi:type 1 glutamine amidotransferase